MTKDGTKIFFLLKKLKTLEKDTMDYYSIFRQLARFFKKDLIEEFVEKVGHDYEYEDLQDYMKERIDYLFNL